MFSKLGSGGGEKSSQHMEGRFCATSSAQATFGGSDSCGIAKGSCLASYWDTRSKKKRGKKQIWKS